MLRHTSKVGLRMASHEQRSMAEGRLAVATSVKTIYFEDHGKPLAFLRMLRHATF